MANGALSGRFEAGYRGAGNELPGKIAAFSKIRNDRKLNLLPVAYTNAVFHSLAAYSY